MGHGLFEGKWKGKGSIMSMYVFVGQRGLIISFIQMFSQKTMHGAGKKYYKGVFKISNS